MEIFAPFLISVFTSSGIIWIARTWISERLKASIKNEYDHKIELFKNKIKAESDVAFAQAQAQLQIANAKFNIEYGRIHERRLEVISELVVKLIALHRAFAQYVSILEYPSSPSKEERRKITATRLDEFDEFYRPNRLFLPAKLAIEIDEFKRELFNKSFQFMRKVEQAREQGASGVSDTDTWTEVSRYAHEEAPKIIARLEDEFRKLLGM